MKHTPGPWTHEERTGYIGTASGVICTMYSSAGCAGIGSNIVVDEQQANARLIAASPKMLTALERLYCEFMSRMTLVRDEDWTPDEIAAEEGARAVISQAKGE